MREDEGEYCCALSRDDTPEADEPQPDAAGNPDTAGGQPVHVRLGAISERDPELVERGVEEAARQAASEAEVAGGMPAVPGVVAHPAGAWAATREGVEGYQEQKRAEEAH